MSLVLTSGLGCHGSKVSTEEFEKICIGPLSLQPLSHFLSFLVKEET